MKLTAESKGELIIDNELRKQLEESAFDLEVRLIKGARETEPWAYFDLAETLLYLGNDQGFVDWLEKGTRRKGTALWQIDTCRDSLSRLKKAGLRVNGLEDGLGVLDNAKTKMKRKIEKQKAKIKSKIKKRGAGQKTKKRKKLV